MSLIPSMLFAVSMTYLIKIDLLRLEQEIKSLEREIHYLLEREKHL